MSNLESSFGSEGVSITHVKLFPVPQNVIRERNRKRCFVPASRPPLPVLPVASLPSASQSLSPPPPSFSQTSTACTFMSGAQPSPHPPHPPRPATSTCPSDTECNLMAANLTYEHAHAFDYTLRNRFFSQKFHEKVCKYD